MPAQLMKIYEAFLAADTHLAYTMMEWLFDRNKIHVPVVTRLSHAGEPGLCLRWSSGKMHGKGRLAAQESVLLVSSMGLQKKKHPPFVAVGVSDQEVFTRVRPVLVLSNHCS